MEGFEPEVHEVDGRVYRVTWSEDDNEFVGTCDQFPSLSWLERDSSEALQGILKMVAEAVTDGLAERLESLPSSDTRNFGYDATSEDLSPLPFDEEDAWLANGEHAQNQRLADRVEKLEAERIAWVAVTERQPTVTGTYAVMDRGLRLLRLEREVDKHWKGVTHWYGPIPICEVERVEA